MKKILFTFVLFFTLVSVFAEKGKEKNIPIPFDSTTQKYAYSKVVEVANTNAAELYKRSRLWSVQKFSDDKFLVDEPNAAITDLGNFPVKVVVSGGLVTIPISFTIIYTVSTQFKDGRFKYNISNIKMSGNANGTTTEQALEVFAKSDENVGLGRNAQRKYIEDVCREIDKNLIVVIADLEKSIKDASGNNKDW